MKKTWDIIAVGDVIHCPNDGAVETVTRVRPSRFDDIVIAQTSRHEHYRPNTDEVTLANIPADPFEGLDYFKEMR